jgi:hypothetical protein
MGYFNHVAIDVNKSDVKVAIILFSAVGGSKARGLKENKGSLEGMI